VVQQYQLGLDESILFYPIGLLNQLYWDWSLFRDRSNEVYFITIRVMICLNLAQLQLLVYTRAAQLVTASDAAYIFFVNMTASPHGHHLFKYELSELYSMYVHLRTSAVDAESLIYFKQ